MKLVEFEHRVFDVAIAAAICAVPSVRRLSSTSISLRIDLTVGGFVDAFFNDQTGTIAFAWILLMIGASLAPITRAGGIYTRLQLP